MSEKNDNKIFSGLGLGRVVRDLPREIWSYKLEMFVIEGGQEYNRIMQEQKQKGVKE